MKPVIPENYVQTQDGVWCHPSRVPANKAYYEKPVAIAISIASKRIRQSSKPLLRKTEQRWFDVLVSRTKGRILKQAITLRMDPPYKSYRPDLAYMDYVEKTLVFVEVKGPHRFREKGIAKAALAAKTYPQFRFELAEWTGSEWKESVLSR